MSEWNHFESGRKRHTDDGLILISLIHKKFKHALDVGCGDGVMAASLSQAKIALQITAIDISEQAVVLARKNLRDTGIEVKHTSLQDFAANKNVTGKFDLVVINPPFFKEGSGRKSSKQENENARREKLLPLNEWARDCASLLKAQGELYVVFPAHRFTELIGEFSEHKLAIKNLWLQEPARTGQIKRFWVRAVKGGKPDLEIKILEIKK